MNTIVEVLVNAVFGRASNRLSECVYKKAICVNVTIVSVRVCVDGFVCLRVSKCVCLCAGVCVLMIVC